MASNLEAGQRRGNKVRMAIWGFAAALWLAPLVAMQFNDDIVWSPFDFMILGILLISISSLFVLTVRRTRNYRVVTAVAFVLLLVYVWAELAVGIFTNLGS